MQRITEPIEVSGADLAHCAREAIHLPQAIQSYGALAVCDADTGKVIRVSDNFEHWLGVGVDAVVGHFLLDALRHLEPAFAVWSAWKQAAQTGASTLVGRVKSADGISVLEVMVHQTGMPAAPAAPAAPVPGAVPPAAAPGTVAKAAASSVLVFEFVPDWSPESAARDDLSLLGRLANSMRATRASQSVADFTNNSVQDIRRFLGYDRVMLYRFAPDWSGEVLSEATADGVEQRFLGQRFPASDIPAQARALYTRNLLRVIADVDAPASALLPAGAEQDHPLDQSYCLLRQPSPMHLVYLRNMGVRATLTISLLHDGQLWGMLACHHYSPRVPPQHHRHSMLVASELIADGLISRLDALLRAEELAWVQNADRAVAVLEERLRKAATLDAAAPLMKTAFKDLAGADHVFGRLNGQDFGEAILSERALADLVQRMHAQAPGAVLATDSLQAWGWRPDDCLAPTPLVGLVAVCPSGDSDSYLVFLRQEWVHTIDWGGRPDQFSPTERADGSVVLGARRSFEVWRQEVDGHCRPWRKFELDMCMRLTVLAVSQHGRITLIDTRERNRLFGASLELLRDMVLVTEAEAAPGELFRRITYVNPALCEHTGYLREELCGKSPSILQGPATDAARLREVSEALRTWKPVSTKLINYKKDGTPYWVEFKIVPIANDLGWFTHWISIQRDVTETVRLQEDLQNKNDRIESVMRATGAGAWTFDWISGLCHFDLYAAALMGHPAEALANVSQQVVWSMTHPEDIAQVRLSMAAHARQETDFHDVQFRMRHREGHWVWIRSRGQIVRWALNGQPAVMIGTYTNVSEQVQLRAQYELQQRFLSDVTDRLPGMVFQFSRDVNGLYAMTFASKKAVDFFGLEPEAVVRDARVLFRKIDPADAQGVLASIGESAATMGIWRHRFRLKATEAGGPQPTLEGFSVPQRDEASGGVVWHGFLTNISDVVRIEAELFQGRIDLEATIAAIPDTLLSLSVDLVVQIARSPQPLILGRLSSSLVGHSIAEVLGEPAGSIFVEAVRQTDARGHVQNIEFPLDLEGELHHFECSLARKEPLRINSDGREAAPSAMKGVGGTGYVVTIRDISKRRIAEEQVALLASHDPLTGLLNRRGLRDHIERISRHSAAHNSQYAVLFVDFDHFKDLNDAHGHQVGDELLKEAANRMAGEIRSRDLLARFGGDEFVVVVPGLTPQSEALEAAARAADRLIGCLKARFYLGGLGYEISCSIGIAFGQGDAQAADVDDVLKSADMAMYQAKSAGRDTYYFFDTRLQADVAYRSAIDQDLRHALERQELRLFFQPIVNRQCEVVGYEALVRWSHPERGLVSPADFIPAAERSGLIVPIGEWVLREASLQLMHWQQESTHQSTYISVNISARQVRRPDFVAATCKVFDETGVDPRLIKLELTESLMHENLDLTVQKMHQLKQLGVQFALDDFGTGYSSMSYIRRLPLDQLKIDRSFVIDLPGDSEAKAITKMIVQLADTVAMEVVAEGVETEAQFAYLKAVGCSFFQGYLFGKPAPLPRIS